MIGKTILSVLGEQRFGLIKPSILRALSGERVTFEGALTSQDGIHRFISATYVPDIDATKQVRGVIVLVNDISEQKRTEEERTNLRVSEKAATEASRLKSDFLANMSHEIRTPINGVIGMMGLLSDTHLFKDVAKSFSFQAQSKGVFLNLEVDSKIPKFVGGDPGRLRQILNNLLSNALKFTEKGQVLIQVHAEQSEEKECSLKIEIKDTGIGIPEKSLSRMFQAFTQADASTTRRFGGTGLGLSICKHLVEQMRGSIGVESKENLGSTFWFKIKLRTAEAPIQKRDLKIGNFKEKSERIFRVLIAEDNPVNQRIALKVLQKMGLSADAVANGLEVLEAHRAIPYDLILMDCQMPLLDGYETTRAIRTSKSQLRRDIPIVAMTANAIRGDKER